MSDEPDLLSLLYHVPVAIAQIDRAGNIGILNPLGCQLLMRLSADPDFDNLFRTLEVDGKLQRMVEDFVPDFGVVAEAYRMACSTTTGEVAYIEFTVHRFEAGRFLVAFRDVTEIVANELRVAQSLRNLESLIKSIARLQVEAKEVEIVLEPLLRQVADWVGSDGAVLLREQPDGNYEQLLQVGNLGGEIGDYQSGEMRLAEVADPLLQDMRPVLITAKHFGLVTQPGSGRMDEEAYYLLKLFVQAAAQSLENADLQEQLVRKERLSAIGQAMSSVVHDLRSPIATIKTAIEMAELKITDPKVVKRMHAIVLRSVDGAFDLVNDVLEFVRDAPVEKKPVSLAALFAGVAENCESAASANGVALDLRGGDIVAQIDHRKLVRALSNLVNNACEALEGRSDGQVTLQGSENQANVLIEVIDNGSGIPEAIRSKLFEAFVTSGKAGGTGLGLAISQQIVQAHAGKISVASDSNGTRFTIELPLHTP